MVDGQRGLGVMVGGEIGVHGLGGWGRIGGMTDYIFDETLVGLTARMAEWGQPGYRAKQVWQALYGECVAGFDGMTALPARLREQLTEAYVFSHLSVARELESTDGETRKVLCRLPDSQQIETVLMAYNKRRTLCISTQAGCALGCVFCATGQMGFRRHLSVGEIVEQVVYFQRVLKARGEQVTNVVFMGMGEPFHNYESTMGAVDVLTDKDGLGLGARRLTISTVGLVPQIERFTAERRQVNLAISLHAATDAERDALLPVNKRWNIAAVMEACRGYVRETGRRVTFEWALIEGKTDTPEQAQALAGLLKGLLCHVNVIPLNPTAGYKGSRSSRERVAAFAAILEAAGVGCTVRMRRGIDIAAGCGQLAAREGLPG